MLRTLRSRLIISHILPLILVVPLVYGALVYQLETRFLLPRLSQDLLNNARLLTEVTRAQYLNPNGAQNIQFLLVRVNLNPSIRVVYLDSNGNILYSNDPDYLRLVGKRLELPGLEQALTGKEELRTESGFLSGGKYSIQAWLPILGMNRQVAGVLWMTYYEASLTQLFNQMRALVVIALIASLALGIVLGSVLALNIGRPVQQVTQSVQSLARGELSGEISETGPEEVRDLIRAVNFLVERLQNMENARRQLLANLVHELGRPLGALRSAIQALAKGAAQDPQLLQDLTGGMDEEAARLQKILEELAHLHDQVLGSLELKRQPIALGEWLPNVLVPWQEAATEKHITWKAEIPADLPEISIDPVRFAQVIGNLLSNAVKYTPPGGWVAVYAYRREGEIFFQVSDSGPGIPKDEQQKIFQPFYRGKYGRRIKQGMGLGLSIARDLTVAHGGRLELESASTKGSTFRVIVPIE